MEVTAVSVSGGKGEFLKGDLMVAEEEMGEVSAWYLMKTSIPSLFFVFIP